MRDPESILGGGDEESLNEEVDAGANCFVGRQPMGRAINDVAWERSSLTGGVEIPEHRCLSGCCAEATDRLG